MGKPVRWFFCMQKSVVKRDDLDSGTPKRGSPYRFDILNSAYSYMIVAAIVAIIIFGIS